MIDARFVPIQKWPGIQTAPYNRKSASFRASYSATLDLLEAELNHLRAKDVLIQAYFDRADIRNDGWPRSSARPKEPGVVLTFDVRREGALVAGMSFPCDRFKAWEDNLRAIAKSLEALRMVDRYGVTQNSEQYRGFAALPPADPNLAKNAAIAFFSRLTGWSADQVASNRTDAYRAACAVAHPDRGGTHGVFVEMQRHWEVLKA